MFKIQEIISWTRGSAWNLDDFSRRYWKATIRKFRRQVHTEDYLVFKVKNREKFSSGSAKCNWSWKSSLFNSRNRCKVVVPDELGHELEHFNWALFRRFIADSHKNPLQSICKSVYLKNETDKTCKVRINADSFSLKKILMELMRSRWNLMPLGQFFSIFDLFSVSPLTAHVDSKFLAMLRLWIFILKFKGFQVLSRNIAWETWQVHQWWTRYPAIVKKQAKTSHEPP